MTEKNKKASTQKEVKYENIKRINSMVQPGSDFSELQNKVKAVRTKIETLISAQRAREYAYRERLQKEEQRIRQEERAALEPAQTFAEESVAPQETIHVVRDAGTAALSKETEAMPEVLHAPKAEKAEKPVERTGNKVPEYIRTKQFDPNEKPSYIRGNFTPVERKEFVKKPPFAKQYPGRGPQGAQGQGQGGYPQRSWNSNSGSASGGYPQRRGPGTSSPVGGAKKPPLQKIEITVSKDRKTFDNTKKKEHVKQYDDKKGMTKRTLIRKGFITENMDEERMGTRKLKNRKQKEIKAFVPIRIEKAVITTENLTVKILSEKIGKTAQEIIKQLMVLGIMTTINSVVDFPTMELVANELGVGLELKLEQSKESLVEEFHEENDNEADLVKRPPIITVMGHVDHGKTSLLDAIRKTSVVAGEAGGITQHIGAYSVTVKNERITFLDTPGHEAFTEMRARGAKVTDIAVLIIAADDGIMPQTVEAINHAKAAKVPILVAINKIDKPGANIEKIKQELTQHELVPEEWGGDTIMVPISAKQGEGIDKLLEMILLLAEYNNYRANPNRKAKGSVVEAKLDKGKGPVANIIVMNGTLRVGDFAVSGMTCGRIRAMADDKGRSIKEAGPSTPVSILGLTDVPSAGDPVYVVEDEKIAKQVIEERLTKMKNEQMNQGQKITLDDVFNKISEGQIKELNVIVKADVQGSVEALKTSLVKLSNDEVKITVVHGAAGAINKSDLMLAGASNAIIIGFNVRADSESKIIAENTGIDIRLYRVIYEAINDMEKAMKGMLAPKYREVVLGRAQVRNVIKVSSVGIIAGSYVLSGKMNRNAKARIYRNDAVIFEGVIDGLKRFKDDVKEVATGYECGISINGFSDYKENDEIEAYIMEEIK